MANIIYNKGLEALVNRDLTGVVLRIMLERSTSTYTPNVDDDFVSDLTSFVEISVASYARQSAASLAVAESDASDNADFTFNTVSFGALESGQTVKAIIGYIQVGGSDATPGDDILLFYIDTATGLPAALGGGTFTFDLTAIRFAQG